MEDKEIEQLIKEALEGYRNAKPSKKAFLNMLKSLPDEGTILEKATPAVSEPPIGALWTAFAKAAVPLVIILLMAAGLGFSGQKDAGLQTQERVSDTKHLGAPERETKAPGFLESVYQGISEGVTRGIEIGDKEDRSDVVPSGQAMPEAASDKADQVPVSKETPAPGGDFGTAGAPEEKTSDIGITGAGVETPAGVDSAVLDYTVVDADTGEAIDNAAVYLDDGSVKCYTDDKGKCLIKNIAKGEYMLSVYKADYSRYEQKKSFSPGVNSGIIELKRQSEAIEPIK